MAKPRIPKKNKESVAQEAGSPTNGVASGMNATASVAEPAAASTEMETKASPKKTMRKPEIVKSEPRSNLVPINLEDEIRQLAYLLSERRGFESGHETEDWLAAEREVRQRYRQQTA